MDLMALEHQILVQAQQAQKLYTELFELYCSVRDARLAEDQERKEAKP